MPEENTRPRLRPLEVKWLDDSRHALYLRDPTGLAPSPATVPGWVALLLSLFDGRRDVPAICAAFELRTGQSIPATRVRDVVAQLDEALFLDSPRLAAARKKVIREYHQAPFRPPALADRVYPTDPARLDAEFRAYESGGPGAAATVGAVRGVVSPHIDYQRGGPIYARTWSQARRALEGAEIAVIFGTDHAGGLGKLTLTRQNYATPLGVLPTATDVVDQVAEAIGEDAAYEEELHHRKEHSIELASVWLHYVMAEAPPGVVPILCGSFQHFTEGEADPSADPTFERALDALSQATRGKRVVAVAAADLAHVGPAFGDSLPLGQPDRTALADKDASLLDAVCRGSSEEFFQQLRVERDQRRICGLPPIYLTLRFLEESRGAVIGYDQCPADAEGGSLVSIAGVLLE
jgi:AmmeMemoRadiSam system protein B